MNKKEMIEFVNAKYDALFRKEVADLREIEQKRFDDFEERVKQKIKEAKAMVVESIVSEFGAEQSKVERQLSFHNYLGSSVLPESKESKKISEIRDRNNAERDDFIERILIFGIKDDTVKEMLVELSARAKQN